MASKVMSMAGFIGNALLFLPLFVPSALFVAQLIPNKQKGRSSRSWKTVAEAFVGLSLMFGAHYFLGMEKVKSIYISGFVCLLALSLGLFASLFHSAGETSIRKTERFDQHIAAIMVMLVIYFDYNLRELHKRR